MGKSNKKAKSDRINALRKQYDAFLEEDKKRKERNEYILGRLDKMRISTALMPLRYKPILEARSSAVNYLGYQPEASSVSTLDRFPSNQSQLFQDMQIKNNEDTCLIQEISKKYILIPKLRSSFSNNYTLNVKRNENINIMQDIHSLQETIPVKDSKPDINESTDWKSKYEILNLLKNEEKQVDNTQTRLNIDVSESNVNSEDLIKNNREQNNIYNNTVKTNLHCETQEQCLNELPEKVLLKEEILEDTLRYGLESQNQKHPKDIVFSNLILDTNVTYHENNESLIKNDGQTDTTNNELQDAKLEYKHTPNTGLEDVSSNYETQPKYNAEILSMDADCSGTQNIDTHTEYDVVENIHPDEVNFSIHNSELVEHQQFASSQQVAYHDEEKANYITENEHSTEVSLAQDFQTNEGIQMKADPKVNPEEQTDIPMNPTQQIEPAIEQIKPAIEQIEPVIEHIENPIDNMSESIEDFNAEQRDMFYSEQTDENYRQDDAYNLDYSENIYQQNEGYPYYEGTQPDAYPIDLNDQVETQRYDPNYEQQYSDSDQGLVKQMEQQSQQYRQPVGNQPEPDLDMLQFEQPIESEKQIEEALDIEDGYIAQQHATEAIDKQRVMEHVEINKHDLSEIRASEEMMG